MTYERPRVREIPTIKLNTEMINKQMDLCSCDFNSLDEFNNFVDRVAKEVNEKEAELINTMLDKCGITIQYMLDNKEKFLYVPHGNAKSLFYCNHLAFTIMTEMVNEEKDGYFTHFGYIVYVSEDNSESIRELLQ